MNKAFLSYVATRFTTLVIFMFFALFADAKTTLPKGVSAENVFTGLSFPFAHSSSLLELPSGDILCVWFGGVHEKNSNTSIWLARLSNGIWNRPVEIANGVELSNHRYATWNPVLWKMPDGEIVVSYKIGDSPRKWHGYYKISRDGGKTWGKPMAYPKGILGPIKNKPLILKSGRIIFPSSTEFHSSFGWNAHFEVSDDNAKTWKKTSFFYNPFVAQCIQPTLILRADSSIVALMRTRNGFIASSISRDNGNTWSSAELLDIPNPNSGLDAVSLADGRFAMVCNPTSERRNKIVIMLSDDGLKWKESMVLDSGDIHQEYAYPAVIQTRDGKLHISYTRNHSNIWHVTVDSKDLK